MADKVCCLVYNYDVASQERLRTTAQLFAYYFKLLITPAPSLRQILWMIGVPQRPQLVAVLADVLAVEAFAEEVVRVAHVEMHSDATVHCFVHQSRQQRLPGHAHALLMLPRLAALGTSPDVKLAQAGIGRDINTLCLSASREPDTMYQTIVSFCVT